MEIFGYEIKRRFNKDAENDSPSQEETTIKSFVPPVDDGGVSTIAAGGYYGQYYDLDGSGTGATDRDMIIKYRGAAEQPEADNAIDDIVNESIAAGDVGALVSLNVDDLEYETDVKRKILNEFDNVYNLFNFTEYGADYFRKWYIDGKIYFHIVVDSANPKAGIQDLRYVDPINMKKVREVKKQVDKLTGVSVEETTEEYFVYSETDLNNSINTNNSDNISGIKVAEEAIIYVTSGIMDSSRTKVLSHLHKSVKIINQLRMLEDALVIYRISRAPERRIFYIDVGNLPKGKAEEYVRNMMSQYRNKIVYDADNGEVRDDRRHKSMLEDFFLPRREGGRGTEINREEVKFHKFTSRLRQKFSNIFLSALKTQLILKGIINEDDWPKISENIFVDYQKDNYFAELKEFEIMRDRFDMMSQVENLVEQGYYSKEWVRKNILAQDDQEIEMIDKQIADEKDEGEGDDGVDDLIAGTQPELETQGDLEQELGKNTEGSLENEIN